MGSKKKNRGERGEDGGLAPMSEGGEMPLHKCKLEKVKLNLAHLPEKEHCKVDKNAKLLKLVILVYLSRYMVI